MQLMSKDQSVTVERCQIATFKHHANRICLACHKQIEKIRISVKLSKAHFTSTTRLHSLASENVQVQQVGQRCDELVVRRTRISRDGQVIGGAKSSFSKQTHSVKHK